MPLLDEFDNTTKKNTKTILNKQRSWYEIPSRNVNVYHEFDFKGVDAKSDGIIFLIFILLAPFIESIILFAFFSEVETSTSQMIVSISTLVFAIVGFIITLTRVRSKIWASGLAFAYLFVIIPTLAVVAGTLILSFFANGKSKGTLDIYSSYAAIICQTLSEIVIIILFLNKTKDAVGLIKMTFKENWKMLLLVAACGLALLFILAQIVFSLAYTKIFHISNNSTNQNDLVSLINNKNVGIKVSYIILLFISSILVAPLCEEICTRYSYFGNTGNKWVALASCTIFFGFIHCGQAGDFVHLPSYLAAGFVLSMLFITARGNFVYTWMVHMSSNLLSFILILTVGGF